MSQSSTITIATPQNRKPRNFIDHVLEPPSYGWQDKENQLVIPTSGELFSEFLFRLNVFRDKKNWLTFFSWARLLLLVSCLFIFLVCYFNVYLLIVAFLFRQTIVASEAPTYAKITGYAAGYWLWLSSTIIAAIAAAVGIFKR